VSTHACNVTGYRNALTLQVPDTIRSYELNFHPVPYGVVTCERYTLGFRVCYGSPSDVFAEERTVVTCHDASPHLLRPSRQTFSLSNGDGAELRRDGDVPVSVNISI
jgi:hypothetical protein